MDGSRDDSVVRGAPRKQEPLRSQAPRRWRLPVTVALLRAYSRKRGFLRLYARTEDAVRVEAAAQVGLEAWAIGYVRIVNGWWWWRRERPKLANQSGIRPAETFKTERRFATMTGSTAAHRAHANAVSVVLRFARIIIPSSLAD